MLTVRRRLRQDVPWRIVRPTFNPAFALALALEEERQGFEAQIIQTIDEQEVQVWPSQPLRKQPDSEREDKTRRQSA